MTPESFVSHGKSRSLFQNTSEGLAEYREGLKQWRISHVVGSGELRRRYIRSRLGQFWLSLSMALSIVILGMIWSILWHIKISDMIAHLAASLIFWQFMQSIVTEGSNLFSTNKHFLLGQRIPPSSFVFALVYKHLLIFGHNAVVLAIIFLILGQPLSWKIALIIPALLMASITSVWLAYFIGIICLRYRDLEQVISSILQLTFYMTPVIWKPEFLSEQYRWILYLNPFAIYISIVRDALLNEPAGWLNWMLALGIAIGGFCASLPFIGKFHRRLMLWI